MAYLIELHLILVLWQLHPNTIIHVIKTMIYSVKYFSLLCPFLVLLFLICFHMQIKGKANSHLIFI